MKEIALHLLDLAENSVSAGASSVEISVHEDIPEDMLSLDIRDDGSGMDPTTAARAIDPFHTSRTERNVGLGLPLLKSAAESAGGDLALESTLGFGTYVKIWFKRSHIDRMPLGDLPCTFLTLLVAHPDTNWRFNYSARTSIETPPECFNFDDQPVKETLGDVALCEPAVLNYLRTLFTENIHGIQTQLGEPILLQ